MKNILYVLISLSLAFASFQCKARSEGADAASMKLDVISELGGDFILIDQDGKKFNSNELRGKMVLLFFGYTNCPDVCPLTLAKYGAAFKLLGDDTVNEVKVVFISLDTKRDTPEKLKKYLSYFPYSPIGLTGKDSEISRVAGLFKILFVKRLTGDATGYLYDHSTASFLLDKKGRVRHLFGQNDRSSTIATVIKVLRKEG
jgi:protein SCO1/2